MEKFLGGNSYPLTIASRKADIKQKLDTHIYLTCSLLTLPAFGLPPTAGAKIVFVEGGVAVIGELTISFSPAPSDHEPPDVPLLVVVVLAAGAEEPGTEVECCGSGKRLCCYGSINISSYTHIAARLDSIALRAMRGPNVTCSLIGALLTMEFIPEEGPVCSGCMEPVRQQLGRAE